MNEQAIETAVATETNATGAIETAVATETNATGAIETAVAPQFVAILSTTVLTEGVFRAEQIAFPESLEGIPSYVGHPDTKALVLALGATQAPTNYFTGLQVGESYLAVPLANNKREEGWTVHQAVEGLHQLRATRVTRIS